VPTGSSSVAKRLCDVPVVKGDKSSVTGPPTGLSREVQLSAVCSGVLVLLLLLFNFTYFLFSFRNLKMPSEPDKVIEWFF
jgi:hypothetical protein